MSKPNDLVQGTLDLLLLKILALEPLHGWAISLRLRSISGDVLQVSEGSLYPALHKLEQEGWIKAEWKQTGEQPPREVLLADAPGPQAARVGGRELAAPVGRHLARRAALRGLRTPCGIEHWWFTAPLRLRSIFRARPRRERARRGAPVPPGAQDRGGHRRGTLRRRRRADRALRAMGGLDQRKEEIRDTRRIHWLTDFLDDVRYAIRSLRRTPGLTAFVVVTLALGIGMTATPFSMLDALDLPALSRAAPERRGHAGEHLARQQLRQFLLSRVPGHPRPHEELRRRGRQRGPGAGRLQRASPEPRRVVRGGMMVSGNYFRVLGVEPELGRGFRDDEDQVPGRDAVVVLGPDFWKREFAADPSVVGRTVRLNGKDFTVIGVAPDSFPGMLRLRPSRLLHAAGDGAACSRPTRRRTSSTDRDDRELIVRARLKPGTTLRAGAQRARRARAGLRARVSQGSTATAARRCTPSSRCGRRTTTPTGSSA